MFDSIRLKQALYSLELDETVRSVTISICSPGGVYFEAPRMIKVIRDFAADKSVRVITAAVGRGAWSAAAMVWLAGDVLAIAEDRSAVGFHAAYDPRDLSKAAELLPEIKSLIKANMKRMSAGAFKYDTKAALKFSPLKRDLSFLGDSIADYLDIAFRAKGAYAFLVIKRDFTVDLWEPKIREKNIQGWPTNVTSVVLKNLDKPVRGGGAGWYLDRAKYSTETTAPQVKAFADASWFAASTHAMQIGSDQHFRPELIAIPPHILFEWSDLSLRAPYGRNQKMLNAKPLWDAIAEHSNARNRPWASSDIQRASFRCSLDAGEIRFRFVTELYRRGEWRVSSSASRGYDHKFRLDDVVSVEVWEPREKNQFGGFGLARVALRDGRSLDIRFDARYSSLKRLTAAWLELAQLYPASKK